MEVLGHLGHALRRDQGSSHGTFELARERGCFKA
jgi:hypothetical protein